MARPLRIAWEGAWEFIGVVSLQSTIGTVNGDEHRSGTGSTDLG